VYRRPPDSARQYLGVMLTPATCSLGLPWCVDNACFDPKRFSQERFLALCRKALLAPTCPAFVTMPDQAPRPGDTVTTALGSSSTVGFA
jgi:hypothetical protein